LRSGAFATEDCCEGSSNQSGVEVEVFEGRPELNLIQQVIRGEKVMKYRRAGVHRPSGGPLPFAGSREVAGKSQIDGLGAPANRWHSDVGTAAMAPQIRIRRNRSETSQEALRCYLTRKWEVSKKEGLGMANDGCSIPWRPPASIKVSPPAPFMKLAGGQLRQLKHKS